jgi:hypothetical protein
MSIHFVKVYFFVRLNILMAGPVKITSSGI